MRKLLLLCVALLTLPLLAATEASKIQLRYRPEPKTTWITEGHLSVKTQVKLPGGEANSAEEQDLVWEDQITDRDLTGTCSVVRQVRKWNRTGDAESLAPAGHFHLSISKLCEQRAGEDAGPPGLMDQPALFPLRNVAVGETWPVEQVSTGTVGLDSKKLPIQTKMLGTGKLVSLDDKMAVLEFSLQVSSQGQNERASTSSQSKMQWTMHVDRATGVPIWQKTVTSTEQTVTLGGSIIIPSTSETVLELKTRVAP